jgi:CheY-like chemotaxis protein
MRRYLVVDDNLAFAENIAEILRDVGDEACVANDGPAALEFLRTHKFDALITDMRMPNFGGAALVREAHRTDPGLPAIVVSAWTDEADLRAAGETGLLAILPKPVPVERLLELLGSARRDAMVVVVDDDEALVENLSELLRERGFSVAGASTLGAADKLGGAPFVALVDLRMPGGPDGTAAARLREQFPEMPLIVISAYAKEDVTTPSLGVFTKPFDTRALVASLEQLHRSTR